MFRPKKTLTLKKITDMFQSLLLVQAGDPILNQLADDGTNVCTYTFHHEHLKKLSTDFSLADFPNLSDSEFCLGVRDARSSAGNEITKIKFIILCTICRWDGQKKIFPVFTVCEISNSLKKKKIYHLPSDYVETLKKLSRLLDVREEHTFLNVRVNALPSEAWNDLKIYSDTKSEYIKIRDHIANSALKIAEPHQKVVLIDLGSGLGDALDVTAQRLTAENKKVRAVGIEKNKKNCKTAVTRFAKKGYQFLNEDILNLSLTFEKYKIEDDSFRLMISSGLLTRLVLNNTIEALQVIQQAYRHCHAFIVTGLTPILTNERIAKKIGWQVQSNHSKMNIYVLEKQENFTPRLSHNQLDLSLHAHPSKVIKGIRAPETVTELDLGLAYLKDCSIEFKEILKLLTNLKTIAVSGHEPWFEEALELAEHKKIVVKIHPELYLDMENDNRKQWELKRFSRGFNDRLNRMLLFKQSLETLHRKIEGNLKHYLPQKDVLNSTELDEYITNLIHIAEKENDDAALFVLATKLKNGIKFINPENSKIETYTSYKDSLFFFNLLFRKGYPVMEEYVRLEQKIENKEKAEKELCRAEKAVKY